MRYHHTDVSYMIFEKGLLPDEAYSEKVLVACFDGTGCSMKDEKNNSTITTLYKKSKEKLTMKSDCIYVRGPGSEENISDGLIGSFHHKFSKYNIERSARSIFNVVLEECRKDRYDKIIIHGFSRGCATAIWFSNLLYEHPLTANIPIYMHALELVMPGYELEEEFNQKYFMLQSNVKECIHYICHQEAEIDLARLLGEKFRCFTVKNLELSENNNETILIKVPNLKIAHVALNGLKFSFSNILGIRHGIGGMMNGITNQTCCQIQENIIVIGLSFIDSEKSQNIPILKDIAINYSVVGNDETNRTWEPNQYNVVTKVASTLIPIIFYTQQAWNFIKPCAYVTLSFLLFIKYLSYDQTISNSKLFKYAQLYVLCQYAQVTYVELNTFFSKTNAAFFQRNKKNNDDLHLEENNTATYFNCPSFFKR